MLFCYFRCRLHLHSQKKFSFGKWLDYHWARTLWANLLKWYEVPISVSLLIHWNMAWTMIPTSNDALRRHLAHISSTAHFAWLATVTGILKIITIYDERFRFSWSLQRRFSYLLHKITQWTRFGGALTLYGNVDRVSFGTELIGQFIWETATDLLELANRRRQLNGKDGIVVISPQNVASTFSGDSTQNSNHALRTLQTNIRL